MKIEIVSWRDDENDEHVFVDGQPVGGVDWTLVDPGRGYDLAEWRENMRYALEGASEAAAKVIAEYFKRGERTIYVTKPRGVVDCDFCLRKVEWDFEANDMLAVEGEDRVTCSGDSPDHRHMAA